MLATAESLLKPLQPLQNDFAQLQSNLHMSILQGGAVAGVIAGAIVAVTLYFLLRNRVSP